MEDIISISIEESFVTFCYFKKDKKIQKEIKTRITIIPKNSS